MVSFIIPMSYLNCYLDTECAEAPPELPHSTKLINSTHVTYICESGFAFSDSSTVKTYACECVRMAGLDTCIGKIILSLMKNDYS